MADDIILKAGLDGSDLEATVARMEKRVKKMADSADKDMKRMGKSMEAAVKIISTQLKKMNKDIAASGKGGPGESLEKSFKNLKKNIRGINKPLEAMIKNLQQVQKLTVIDLGAEGGTRKSMPRFEVRDQIDTEMAKIQGDVLMQKLGVIFLSAEGIVSNSAYNMRKDLEKAFEDSTMSGQQLLTLVKQLESNLKAMGAAALDAQVLDVGGKQITRSRGEDVVAGVFAEEKGQEMLTRIDTLMESADDRVKAGAAILKANLVGLLDQGAAEVGGENLRKKINEITTAYNELSGLKPVDLIQAEETNDAIKLRNAYDVVGKVYKRIQTEGTSQAKKRAKEIHDNIVSVKELADSHKVSAGVANAAIRSQLSTLKELGQFKVEDPIHRMLADMDLNALRDKMFKLMDSANEEVSKQARVLEKELAKMLDGDIPTEQLLNKLKTVQAAVEKVIEQARAGQNLQFIDPDVGGVGGQRSSLENVGKGVEAGLKHSDLEQRAQQLMSSTEEIVRDGSLRVQAQLQGIFDIEDEGNQLSTLKGIEDQLKVIEAIKPIEYVKAEQKAAVQSYNGALLDVGKSIGELADITDEEGRQAVSAALDVVVASKKRVSANEAVAKSEEKALSKSKKDIDAQIKRIKAANKEREKATQLTKLQQEATDSLGQAAKKVNLADTYKRLNSVISQSKSLLKSTSSEARSVGQTLQDAGEKAKVSLEKGDKSAEELNDELKRMEDLARKAGNAFDTNVSGGAKRSSVSIWKVGNALDRTGVRGAGGIIRIVDAFKGLGPAAIGAAVAIGSVLIVVTKLAEAVVALGKMAAKAFGEFIKGSVDTAKQIEITDRHLGSLIKQPELGGAFRDYLLDQSFKVGIDLTTDFARVVVPLAETTDQIERAAEAAGVLAHAYGETGESIARAFKQAAGGHFRPFQQLFGITPGEIDTIQEYQEKLGELPGVIKGIEEALEMRGLSLESFEGTLQLITGRLEVLKTQVRLTVGTPIRDALGVQLQKIFDIVEERRPAFENFFEGLGITIAGVTTKAGELVESLIGDVTDQDLADLGGAMGVLGDSVEEVLEAIRGLFGEDDTSFVDVLTKLTDAMNGLVDTTGDLIEALNGYFDIKKKIGDIGISDRVTLGAAGDIAKETAITKTIGPLRGIVGSIGFAVKSFAGEATEEDRARFLQSIAESFPGGEQVTLEQGIWDMLFPPVEFVKELSNVGKTATETSEEVENAFNSIHESSELLRDPTYTLQDLADALETLGKAEAKLELDRRQSEAKLITKFARSKIKDELKASQDREQLERDHGQSLLELDFDLASKRDKSGRTFEDKNAASYVKYQDKLTDIDLKASDKRIDIEEKFREKLEDIKRRFDLDAEEAIRRNDAVGLLRLRRKLRADLQEAKIQRRRSEDDVADNAEKEHEAAKIAYDRTLRDNETFQDNKLKELEIADGERRDEMIRQLRWEKDELKLAAQEQKTARSLEEKQAKADLEQSFTDRREAWAIQYSEEFDVVDYWKGLETEMLRTALKEQDYLLLETYKKWLSYLPGMKAVVDQIYRFSAPWEGSLNAYEEMMGQLPGYDPDLEGVGGRLLIPPYEKPKDDPIGGRLHHGGLVTGGNVYGVNERGVEAFMATRAGIVLPREAMMLSLQNKNGATNIDNSRRVDANVDLIDPNQMTPILRTMARSLLTDEILNIGF